MRYFWYILVLAISLVDTSKSYAQDYRIEIDASKVRNMPALCDAVSVSTIKNGIIEAFANESEYIELRKMLSADCYKVERIDTYLGKSIAKLKKDVQMTSNGDVLLSQWNCYPEYDTYIEVMQQWAEQYANIAKLVEIGKSREGRSVLAMRIAADGDTTMRPRVFYTSTMHGDEVCGYALSLRLIDYILKNYRNGNDIVDNIVDNVVLYINPLSNPDGTYYGGNNTILNARRYNAANVDLNRNFPALGALSKQSYEPETTMMMNFAESRRFCISANFHGGDETLNYPWDSYYESEMPLPDKEWFLDVCSRYIAQLRTHSANMMTTVTPEGYVFGSEWYKVHGGRQDWMLYNMRCREITIELSKSKLLDSDMLEEYWQANRDPLLQLILEANQSVMGKVISTDGTPLNAEVVIIGLDKENCHSSVFCDANGVYTRPLMAAKSYEVCAVADGYQTECKTVETIEDNPIRLDFQLHEGISINPLLSTLDPNIDNDNVKIWQQDQSIRISADSQIKSVEIYDILGHRVLYDSPSQCDIEYSIRNLQTGCYVVKIAISSIIKTSKITIVK